LKVKWDSYKKISRTSLDLIYEGYEGREVEWLEYVIRNTDCEDFNGIFWNGFFLEIATWRRFCLKMYFKKF